MNKQQEPRLRFKGFTGNWEEKVLGKIFEISSASRVLKEQWQKEGVPFFRTSDVVAAFKGESNEEAFISFELFEELAKKSGRPQKDDLLVTGGGSIGIPFLIQNDQPIYFKDADLLWLKSAGKINGSFLFYSFLSNKFKSYLKSISHTGTISHYTVIQAKFTPITLPSPAEQTHLGLFFRRLDSQIAESRAVLEKSRQLKKAMLAKMFPANGEKIPKIRFKGFEGEWECRKLGAEVEIVGGGTPDTTNSTYWNGDIDWYSPTEIGEAAYANGSVKKITLLGLQKSSAQILPANRTVLFTSRASIGDMAILTKDGATNQGFQSFVVGERLDVYFLYTMGFKIKDYALKNASGSTFLEISKNTLSQMEFFAPSLKEQTAIGLFFRQLDETIALQSAEVEKLNQLKKGLLAAMLV